MKRMIFSILLVLASFLSSRIPPANASIGSSTSSDTLLIANTVSTDFASQVYNNLRHALTKSLKYKTINKKAQILEYLHEKFQKEAIQHIQQHLSPSQIHSLALQVKRYNALAKKLEWIEQKLSQRVQHISLFNPLMDNDDRSIEMNLCEKYFLTFHTLSIDTLLPLKQWRAIQVHLGSSLLSREEFFQRFTYKYQRDFRTYWRTIFSDAEAREVYELAKSNPVFILFINKIRTSSFDIDHLTRRIYEKFYESYENKFSRFLSKLLGKEKSIDKEYAASVAQLRNLEILQATYPIHP